MTKQDPTDQNTDLVHELADDSKYLVESLGGARGIFESGSPAIVFVAAYAITNQQLKPAVYAALSLGLVLAVLRLVKRESLIQVTSGFIGIAFSAWLATKSGKAENFFLPGILTNVGYAAACVISLALNRPLLGYVLEAMRGTQNVNWRKNPSLLKKYRAITILWSGVFLIRVLIMAPLYLANETVLLGFFKVALGWPLFALAAYATFLMSKRTIKP